MEKFYKFISNIYDDVGINEYSMTLGRSILKFFNMNHPEREFRKNLDLCCGTGTLCNFFKENGIESKGVDISDYMLDIAKEKYPDIEFIKADVVTYEDDHQYDFITCIDDALNHILEIDDVKTIFKNVNSYLCDGGYFIFDILIGYLLPETHVIQISDDKKIIYKIKILKNNIMHTITHYYENEKLAWQYEDYGERIYTFDEIFRMLNETGFVVERCGQEFFDDNAHIKLKIIARKDEISID